MKNLLILFFAIPLMTMGQIEIDSISYTQYLDSGSHTDYGKIILIEKPSKKDMEYFTSAPTMYLMELYMMDTKNDSVEVLIPNSKNTWIKQPRPKTFEDFYYWTKEYFREQLKEENDTGERN